MDFPVVRNGKKLSNSRNKPGVTDKEVTADIKADTESEEEWDFLRIPALISQLAEKQSTEKQGKLEKQGSKSDKYCYF